MSNGHGAKDVLLGKLVRPIAHNNLLIEQSTRTFYACEIGIVIRVDWIPEERVLEIDILFAEQIVERQYSSLSYFWKYWHPAIKRSP